MNFPAGTQDGSALVNVYARGLSFSSRGVLYSIMARTNDVPKSIGELIDQIECVREELLTIQHSLEKIERAPSTDSRDKQSEEVVRLSFSTESVQY
jgi:hypothetical protein